MSVVRSVRIGPDTKSISVPVEQKQEERSVVYERNLEHVQTAPAIARDVEVLPMATNPGPASIRAELESRYRELLKLGFITKEQYETIMKDDKK